MEASQKIAVAGATGRVGRHVVDVLRERGHDVVEMSRAQGVDVITGDGLAEALVGVDAIVDAATGPSPVYEEASEFFTTAGRNLHAAGEKVGVQRMIVVSIIGIDAFTGGYSAAKLDHERVALAGPIPARIVRAAQFHEFVGQLVDWGRQGDVAYVAKMRIQPVAARALAEVLADLALDPASAAPGLPMVEVAGPQEENLVDLATALTARRSDPVQIQGASDPNDPDAHLNESGALLPSPDAILAGPTFQEWLDAGERMP
jgi:uncharacterized protein YbjT (DUF2867 family)